MILGGELVIDSGGLSVADLGCRNKLLRDRRRVVRALDSRRVELRPFKRNRVEMDRLAPGDVIQAPVAVRVDVQHDLGHRPGRQHGCPDDPGYNQGAGKKNEVEPMEGHLFSPQGTPVQPGE